MIMYDAEKLWGLRRMFYIPVLLLLAIYFVSVNFVIYHEHLHKDAFTECGVSSEITYYNFGLAGNTTTQPILDYNKRACAYNTVNVIDGWYNGSD